MTDTLDTQSGEDSSDAEYAPVKRPRSNPATVKQKGQTSNGSRKRRP